MNKRRIHLEVARKDLPKNPKVGSRWNFTIRRAGRPSDVRSEILQLEKVKGGYIATVKIIKLDRGYRMLQQGGTYVCLFTVTGNAGFTKSMPTDVAA